MLKKIYKNIGWLFLAEFVGTCLIFGINILIARKLGVDNFGQYSFVMSFVMFFASIADFGFNTVFIRDISQNHKLAKKYLEHSLLLKFFSGILILLITLISSRIFARDVPMMFFLVASLYVVFNSTNELLRAIFRARQLMKLEACFKVGERIIFFLISFLIIKVGINSILPILYTYLASSLLFLFFIIVFFNNRIGRLIFKVDRNNLIYFLKEGWPIGLGAFFVTVYTSVDIILLKILLKDFTQIGIYAAAYKFLILAVTGLGLISAAFFPVLSEQVKSSKKPPIFKQYLGTVFLVAMLGFSFLFFLNKEIVNIFYGSNFILSARVLSILSISLIFIAIRDPFTYLFIAQGRKYVYLITVGIAAIANIIANIIVIPRYGIIGASWATVIAEFFVCIVTIGFVVIRTPNES